MAFSAFSIMNWSVKQEQAADTVILNKETPLKGHIEGHLKTVPNFLTWRQHQRSAYF
jgi:hypothetical protein